MSEYQCVICNGDTKIHFSNCKDINIRVTSGTFNWYECLNCNTLSIFPLVEDKIISSYYGELYIASAYGESKQFKLLDLNIDSTFSVRIKTLKKLFPDGKFSFLDVGCGEGELLFNLAHHFPEASLYGMDYYVGAAKEYHKSTNVTFLEGSINDILFEQKFDIISSSQVIEHMQRPADYIRFLELNGTPALITMNDYPWVKSYSYKIFKSNWVDLDTPRHRTLFTDKSIEILFRDYKLENKILFTSFWAYFYSFWNCLGVKPYASKNIISKSFMRVANKIIYTICRYWLPKDNHRCLTIFIKRA